MKKIYLPIARYNNEIKHTIGLNEYDDIRNMLNSKVAEAES